MKRLFLIVVLVAAAWSANAQKYMIVNSEKIFKSLDAYNSAIESLDKLAEHGIEFVPCTGRALVGIPQEVLAHPSVHYAVSSNGAVVSRIACDVEGAVSSETLRRVPLSRAKALEVLQIARAHDVTFDIFADGHSYLRRDLYDRLAEFVPDDPGTLDSIRWNRTPVDEEPEQTLARIDTLERLAMYWHDPRDRDEIVRALGDVSGIAVTRSYPMNIEVMDEEASKGASMAWLCEKLGESLADTLAFGDNFNDGEMLRLCGTAFVTENAPEKMKEMFPVAPSCDDDGVLVKIRELFALTDSL